MNRIKYPRTPHLPFSEGATKDDRILTTIDHFKNKEIVITEKMDGENSTLYYNYYHARSVDSSTHPSRNWLKRFHSEMCFLIPEGWRVCGENLYAKHSILYEKLPSYFLGFSVWDETNTGLSWDETLSFFSSIGVIAVPVLYRGPFILDNILDTIKSLNTNTQEGIVIRTVGKIQYSEFNLHFAKWVRKGHIQTDSHWMFSKIEKIRLEMIND